MMTMKMTRMPPPLECARQKTFSPLSRICSHTHLPPNRDSILDPALSSHHVAHVWGARARHIRRHVRNIARTMLFRLHSRRITMLLSEQVSPRFSHVLPPLEPYRSKAGSLAELQHRQTSSQAHCESYPNPLSRAPTRPMNLPSWPLPSLRVPDQGLQARPNLRGRGSGKHPPLR